MGVLDGKLSVVTGGSRGIGRSIALALAAEGSDVALIYAHKREPAEEVANLITAMGRKSNVYQADVSLPEEDDRVVAEIKKDFGPVQILVNNAGITRDKSFLKMNRDMWHEVLNVNLTGAAMMMHRLIPGMIDPGWGRIVNITSVVG